MILSVYGERVQKGEWRDYAIDTLPDMAVFSVFRAAKDKPAFTIAKIPGRGWLKPAQYTVGDGLKTLKEGGSLREVLDGVFGGGG